MPACRSCGVSVRVVSKPSGRPLELDLEPTPEGTVIIAVDGAALVLNRGAAAAFSQPKYRPHRASCKSVKKR